ncbi:hypothetical protein ACJW30_05G017000 [Castanea mollissima]
MQFDSLDDVETFYKEFAKKEAFGIRIRTSKKAPRSDNVTSCIYACCSQGQHKTKNALDNGLNKDDENKARRTMLRVMKNNKLQKWVVKGFDNNHNHGIISLKSSLVEKFGEEGLPTGKTFTSRDCWNHLRDVRGKNLDVGDASAVLNYCQKKQAQNSNFFYAIQCDDVGHMVNFFWVDAQSRMAYQYFGDYDMPFAPFTGLNHHYETEQTFEPKSIIMDQDLAMGAAIAKVFPRTRHQKLSHIYHKNVEKFEEAWKNLILTYGLERNEWVEGLYNIRESWVPVYNRNTFFAGMNTIQRSESINAFFDSFVNSRTTLKDFVVKFAKAVDSRYKKERKEDFDSRHKTPSLVIGSKIEHQAASIYTRTILSKFQKELVSSNHFTKEKVEKNGTFYRYKLNLESKVCECDCQLFEFMGIVKNVFQIPSHYILRRWTKEANKELKSVEYRSSFEDEHHMSRALRSIHVCHV